MNGSCFNSLTLLLFLPLILDFAWNSLMNGLCFKLLFLYSPIPDSVTILKFRSTDEVSALILQRWAHQVDITVMMTILKFGVESCYNDTEHWRWIFFINMRILKFDVESCYNDTEDGFSSIQINVYIYRDTGPELSFVFLQYKLMFTFVGSLTPGGTTRKKISRWWQNL